MSVDNMASMIAADVLPGRAVLRRSVFATVRAKRTIRFLSIFQHWQYSYGDMILVLSCPSESLKITPNKRRKGLKFGGSRGGAVPLRWHTFVPAREDGSSCFLHRWN